MPSQINLTALMYFHFDIKLPMARLKSAYFSQYYLQVCSKT